MELCVTNSTLILQQQMNLITKIRMAVGKNDMKRQAHPKTEKVVSFDAKKIELTMRHENDYETVKQ
jgi:hypothetical protein